jgi:hypothetical protein
MSAHAPTAFDFAAFTRAVEGRDTDGQLECYAPDATVTIVDRTTPPGAPRVLSGREEIRSWIADVSSRDMSHAVGTTVMDEHGAAFTEACRYPDGTNVLCMTVFRLADGLIGEQTVLQAWDEA